MHSNRALPLLSVLGLTSSAALAGVTFTDDLSNGTNFTVLGDADTQATFGYDYSADGIPAAPNGGGDTVGLKMEANLTAGTAAEIAAVTPLGFSGSPYTVTFDMWSNFAIGSGSSTEFIGGSVGNLTSTGRGGATMIATGDGGSSRDYRLYKDDGEQFFASLQYGPSLTSNNGSDATLSAAFPGLTPPAAQGQAAGSSDPGDTAFGWITMTINVDPNAVLQGTTNDPGTATFSLFSHASGTSVEIGTIDNSNGGTVVNMGDNFGFVYADLFSSLASDPQFQFGIFDNLTITEVPEPGSAALALLGALGLLARRRR